MSVSTDKTINHWMIKAKSSGNTAESLWEDAVSYFMWCEQNPIYKNEVIKQTGQVSNVEYPRPFNLPALCLHCGITIQYIMDIGKNVSAGDWHLVAQKILQVIYAQNFEYSMVGIFNGNMAIKKLNLGGEDSGGGAGVSSTINIEVVQIAGTPKLSSSEYEQKNVE